MKLNQTKLIKACILGLSARVVLFFPQFKRQLNSWWSTHFFIIQNSSHAKTTSYIRYGSNQLEGLFPLHILAQTFIPILLADLLRNPKHVLISIYAGLQLILSTIIQFFEKTPKIWFFISIKSRHLWRKSYLRYFQKQIKFDTLQSVNFATYQQLLEWTICHKTQPTNLFIRGNNSLRKYQIRKNKKILLKKLLFQMFLQFLSYILYIYIYIYIYIYVVPLISFQPFFIQAFKTAPVHNSSLDTDCLTKMGINTVPQPPYSPDLAPCDFWLFPKLRSCRYETIEMK